MKTSIQLELLKSKIPLHDLTIGQAMDIAKIPPIYNEKRISALITHIVDDSDLASYLTVQERYYILLNHLSLSNNKYIDVDSDYSEFFIGNKGKIKHNEKIELQQELFINHLLGSHIEVIEMQAEENTFDYIAGAMACQLSGNLAKVLQFDNDIEQWQWQTLDVKFLEKSNSEQLTDILIERFRLIENLDSYQFNLLCDAYYLGVEQLQHFVEPYFFYDGIALLSQDEQGGAGEKMPVRFHSLTFLRGTAGHIAEYVVKRYDVDNGAWQHEHE